MQLILVCLVGLAWWRAAARYRSHELSASEFGGWYLFWLVVGAVAAVPNLASRAAAAVGVGRGSDLAVYLAVLLAFYLIARTYLRLERLEHNLTKLVRDQALRDTASQEAPRADPGGTT